MKSERLGMAMIAASLIAIVAIVMLHSEHQAGARRAQTRNQGISLVRMLSAIPYEQLVPAGASPRLLQNVLQLPGNAQLGYGVVVDTKGATLAEVNAAGALVPAAVNSPDPASWFGERDLVSPGDGRKIREFYGPVLDKGHLTGYVRLGFFETPGGLVGLLGMEQLSFFALLALPVFLLTPLFYFLVRREIRPLGEIRQQLQRMAESGAPATAELKVGDDLRGFMLRFTEFIERTQGRIRDLDAERFTTLTSNRMLSYRQEKVESVLHALPEGLMVVDEAGAVSFANGKLARLLGVDAGAIVGLPAREAVPLPEVAAFMTRCQANPGHAYRGEGIEFSPAADAGRRIAARAYPLLCPRNPGEVLGLLVVFRDITAEFLSRNAGAEFVSHVSHELKSPLNVLTMYSEMLLEDQGKSPELHIEAVNVIHDEVERMGSLINNLLNVSKLETGSIALERSRVRIGDLLQEVTGSVERNAKGKDIEVSIKLPQDLSPVLLDKDLLRIAVSNLLTNAIKYNRPGGSVTLSAEESDTHIAVRVTDTGIGISAEDLPKVFDKFYRSAEGSATASGHGLGLFLARQITELHQGRLTVTSELGKGTEFVMLLKKSLAILEEAVKL
jgi:PAS domain S-box-containing protein